MRTHECANVELLYGAPDHEYGWSKPERIAEREARGWQQVDPSKPVSGERFPKGLTRVTNKSSAVLMRRKKVASPHLPQPAALTKDEAKKEAA